MCVLCLVCVYVSGLCVCLCFVCVCCVCGMRLFAVSNFVCGVTFCYLY